MAQANHTPGPWQVAGTRHKGNLEIGDNTRLHFVGPDGDAVAAVFFDMETGRGLADARLIASAPQILEAAQSCEPWLEAALECKDWHWDLDQRRYAQDALNSLRAVLSSLRVRT